MITVFMKSLAVAALLVATCSAAQSPSLRCPDPLPPLNVENGIPISPSELTSGAELFYWVIEEEVSLNSFNIERSGSTIVVNAYIDDRGQGMMLPSNCLKIPLGTFPPGAYSLRTNLFIRVPPQVQFPATPTATSLRLLSIASATTAVTTVPRTTLIFLLLLMCLIGSHFARVGRIKADAGNT